MRKVNSLCVSNMQNYQVSLSESLSSQVFGEMHSQPMRAPGVSSWICNLLSPAFPCSSNHRPRSLVDQLSPLRRVSRFECRKESNPSPRVQIPSLNNGIPRPPSCDTPISASIHPVHPVRLSCHPFIGHPSLPPTLRCSSSRRVIRCFQ